MNIGIVRGTVTSTLKHPAYDGHSLMVVEIVKPDGTPTGKEVLAVDRVQSGVGDRVLVLKEGNSTRAILGKKDLPLLELIVGVVDDVSIGT